MDILKDFNTDSSAWWKYAKMQGPPSFKIHLDSVAVLIILLDLFVYIFKIFSRISQMLMTLFLCQYFLNILYHSGVITGNNDTVYMNTELPSVLCFLNPVWSHTCDMSRHSTGTLVNSTSVPLVLRDFKKLYLRSNIQISRSPITDCGH